jgi:voltage-gated potassium channel
MWDIARDPKVRPLGVWLMTLLVIGAAFYHNVEGWSWIDSFYFSVIALATVGFGDLAPKTDLGKLFTIFYVLAGIGILVAFVDATVQRGSQRRFRLRGGGGTREAPEPDRGIDGDLPGP